MNNLISEIQGKSVFIQSFCVEYAENSLVAKMQLIGENKKSYYAVFQNASVIKLSHISYPFQISCFEIVDNASRGYQNDSRFFVNDYDDGDLSFYCEDFEIFND